MWLSWTKHFTPKLVRSSGRTKISTLKLSQTGNFSYNFQPSIYNWQTVPRRWFARYLHWITDNRRRFSLRRPRRRCTIMQIEFTSAYSRPYCKEATGCYISVQFIIWSHGSLHKSLIMQDIWCTTHKWRTFQWIILMYVHWNFMEGLFSVQLAGGSPFRRIPMDQTMNVTFSEDKDDRDCDKSQLEDRRCK